MMTAQTAPDESKAVQPDWIITRLAELDAIIQTTDDDNVWVIAFLEYLALRQLQVGGEYGE